MNNTNTKKPTERKSWVEMISEYLPEHSQYFGSHLSKAHDNCRQHFSAMVADACAMVSAVCANNGELAFEIGMSKDLIGTDEREWAKNAALVATRISVLNNIGNGSSGMIMHDAVDMNRQCANYKIYLLASAITLADRVAVKELIDDTNISITQYNALANLCAVVASIGRIAA